MLGPLWLWCESDLSAQIIVQSEAHGGESTLKSSEEHQRSVAEALTLVTYM